MKYSLILICPLTLGFLLLAKRPAMDEQDGMQVSLNSVEAQIRLILETRERTVKFYFSLRKGIVRKMGKYLFYKFEILRS